MYNAEFLKEDQSESPVGNKSIESQASLFCSFLLHSWPLLNNDVLGRTWVLAENLMLHYYSEDYFCRSVHASMLSHYIICPGWPHASEIQLSQGWCIMNLSHSVTKYVALTCQGIPFASFETIYYAIIYCWSALYSCTDSSHAFCILFIDLLITLFQQHAR